MDSCAFINTNTAAMYALLLLCREHERRERLVFSASLVHSCCRPSLSLPPSLFHLSLSLSLSRSLALSLSLSLSLSLTHTHTVTARPLFLFAALLLCTALESPLTPASPVRKHKPPLTLRGLTDRSTQPPVLAVGHRHLQSALPHPPPGRGVLATLQRPQAGPARRGGGCGSLAAA